MCGFATVYALWYLQINYPRTEDELRAHFLLPEELDIDANGHLLYDNQTSSGNAAGGDLECPVDTIPRIIHQTFSTAEVPERWRAAQKSCQALHSENWKYMFWTDSSAEEFIGNHYPGFYDTYRAYPYAIQRADAIRYFVLYHYGGFYLDLDVGCKRELTSLLRRDALLPKTQPMGVSNDVMAAPARHPFFEQVIRSLRSNSFSRGTKYTTVLFTTGPMFLTAQVVRFWERPAHGGRDSLPPLHATGSACRSATQVRIIPPDLYGSNERSFFAHYPGSSWHGQDVDLVKYVAAQKKSTVLTIALLLGIIALSLYVLRRRRQAMVDVVKLGFGNA